MSHQESAPDYRDVIAQISPTARLINCKDNLQWIIQTKSGDIWRSKSHWRWRDTMLAHLDVHAALSGNDAYRLDAPGRKSVEALPYMHP